MPAPQPKGPFCQSCAMPLDKPEDFGTAASGFRINDYCHYCFSDGAFTNPTISLREMTDLCVGVLTKRGMPQAQASSLMADVLPKLKRWRQVATTAVV